MCKGRFRIIIKVGQLKEKCSARNCSCRATRSEKLMAQSQNKGERCGSFDSFKYEKLSKQYSFKKIYGGRKKWNRNDIVKTLVEFPHVRFIVFCTFEWRFESYGCRLDELPTEI
jgi:hypothetical protein